MWRLVAIDKAASLEEINRSWSLDDIMEANAVLDFQADASSPPRTEGQRT